MSTWVSAQSPLKISTVLMFGASNELSKAYLSSMNKVQGSLDISWTQETEKSTQEKQK